MSYDFFFKVVSILFSMAFFIFAYVLRIRAGTAYHPAVIFSFAWGCFTFIPLLAIFPAPVNPFAILYILGCVISFSTPLFLSKNKNFYSKFKKNIAKRQIYLKHLDSKFIRVILFFSFFMGVLFCFLTMFINGWSIYDILFDLLATSGRFAALRGNEGMEYGLVGTLGVVFTYFSASLSGLVWQLRETKSSRLFAIFFGLTPGVLAMVIQSSKLIFLVASCFFVSGMLIANMHKLKPLQINFSKVYALGKVSLIIAPFILISFVSREHYGDLDDLSKTWDALKFAFASYALGQTYAFSDFFSFYIGMDSTSHYNQDYYRMGAYTFSSLADLFGANIDFPPGLYLETGWYSDIFETNVFTAFRGLLLDYGVMGSFAVFTMLGMISNAAFIFIMGAKINHFANFAYMHIVVFIIMTYLISVFMARYMYANYVLLCVLFLMNDFIFKSRSKLLKSNEIQSNNNN